MKNEEYPAPESTYSYQKKSVTLLNKQEKPFLCY